jgi:hypothetical protein
MRSSRRAPIAVCSSSPTSRQRWIAAPMAGDDVGEQQVFLAEGAEFTLLEVERAPVGLGDDDRQ